MITEEAPVATDKQRLIDAESRLNQALQRLYALRRAALYGQYEPAEFDRAILAYREAEAEVVQAREAYARTQDESPVESFKPTKRMKFARWLVDTGRLSDWNLGQEELPQITILL